MHATHTVQSSKVRNSCSCMVLFGMECFGMVEIWYIFEWYIVPHRYMVWYGYGMVEVWHTLDYWLAVITGCRIVITDYGRVITSCCSMCVLLVITVTPLPGGHLLDVNGSTCWTIVWYACLWWLKHETDPIGCEPNIGNWNNSVSVGSRIFPPPLVSYTSSPLTNILNNPCNFLSWKCNSRPSLPIQGWCRFSPEILYFLKLVPISNLPLSFFISLFLLFSQPL